MHPNTRVLQITAGHFYFKMIFNLRKNITQSKKLNLIYPLKWWRKNLKYVNNNLQKKTYLIKKRLVVFLHSVFFSFFVLILRWNKKWLNDQGLRCTHRMCDAEEKKSPRQLTANSAVFTLTAAWKVRTFLRNVKCKSKLNFLAISKVIFLFLLLLNDTNWPRGPALLLCKASQGSGLLKILELRFLILIRFNSAFQTP